MSDFKNVKQNSDIYTFVIIKEIFAFLVQKCKYLISEQNWVTHPVPFLN